MYNILQHFFVHFSKIRWQHCPVRMLESENKYEGIKGKRGVTRGFLSEKDLRRSNSSDCIVSANKVRDCPI